MKLISTSSLLLLVLAASAVSPLYAAPRVISKQEKTSIKKIEKKKKEEERDRKKIAKDVKKRAAALKKALAKITPIPAPDLKVADSELEGLEKAAEEGDAAAMVRLGHYHMLHMQPGYQKKAGDHFRRAAEIDQGDAAAWLALFEYITSPDGGKAAESPRQKCCNQAKAAAENNSCLGAYLAGLMSEDEEERLELYTKAAYAGFVPAMRALGEMMAEAAYQNQATRHAPMPEDACMWLEFAYRNGDAQAALVRSGSSHMYRATGAPYSTDPAEVEKWLRHSLELALKYERTWYGSIFDHSGPSKNAYAWGGNRMCLLLQIYSALLEVREFDNRSVSDVTSECSNTLKKMAAAQDTEAMAAAIMLSRRWSFWMGIEAANPGILKDKDWMPKLKQKAASGDALAARLVKECNMLPK